MGLLRGNELDAAIADLGDGWHLVQESGCEALRYDWKTPDFATAFAIATRLALMAESADHHPLISVEWGAVSVTWWTHSAGGVTAADVAMAKKCATL